MEPWSKLCAAYPHQDVSKATLMVFYERLSKFEIEKIAHAFDAVIDRCKFFPMPAEILFAINEQAVGSGQELLEGPRPSKQEAEKVIRQLKVFIAENEKRDAERREKKLNARRAYLKAQAILINAQEKEH